jgi:hypothetical protein
MVSPTLTQLLERARTRFGVEVEILDAGLRTVYPEGGSDLSRCASDSEGVRDKLMEALTAGRPQRIEGLGSDYRVYRLPQSAKRRGSNGLMAIRKGVGGLETPDTESWSDLARAMVEADLAALDSLSDEKQNSRRLNGALRFVQHVLHATNETAVADALIHAAAVWYDVDARIYRRTLSGEFELYTCLPGVQPSANTLGLPVEASSLDLVRHYQSSVEGSALGASHDTVLVPLSGDDRVDWLLVLCGVVPPEADSVLRLVGRAAGIQLTSCTARRHSEARRHFESILGEPTRAPELSVMRTVQALAQLLNAAAASLTLGRSGQARRIAVVGPMVASEDLSESNRRDSRLVRELPLGGNDVATLEVGAAMNERFSYDSLAVFDACSTVLRTWIAGSLSAFEEPQSLAFDADARGFSARIQEELERARRFDLRLSLILIEVPASTETLALLQETLRRELRGSDVTGAMSGTQVAALLTHTDALGLDNVVRRVRQRLADTAERLNVSGLKVGQAAFTPEVRTADALLDLALRQAQPVIVH